MAVSIIISYHQEGQLFLEECINQLRNSLHIYPYEIIAVDDCSQIPLGPIENVTILRAKTQAGVGASFDWGVSCAKYDIIFLMACDVRFIDNGWDIFLLEEVENNPKSLVCTTCVGLNNEKPENMDLALRRGHGYPGATLLIFHDHISNPRKKSNFRGLHQAKWLVDDNKEPHEIPCILGACYGVTKQWYEYIDGFWGHRLWGSLEPYISLKSYLFGGSCRIAPKAETGHIFKAAGTHGTPQEALVYNMILISKLLFLDSERLINYIGYDTNVIKAKRQIQSNIAEIEAKRREYQTKTVFPVEKYVKKFSLDYRK